MIFYAFGWIIINMKAIQILILSLFLSSCTMYTEKRSEALSQAVTATSDSIKYARFDLAEEYSDEAVKLALPPKNRIKINPIFTSKSVISEGVGFEKSKVNASEENGVLRIVVPEKFKHANLLVQGSDEWENLIKTKNFAETLQKDNKNLMNLKNAINAELLKQQETNNKMVVELNDLKAKILKKDLIIIRRNITIVSLIAAFALAAYLRLKGIL